MNQRKKYRDWNWYATSAHVWSPPLVSGDCGACSFIIRVLVEDQSYPLAVIWNSPPRCQSLTFSLRDLENRSETTSGWLGREAVDLGNVGNTSQDRVLATGASEDELLTADSGVVNGGRGLDILSRALTSLVVGREAPRVSLALSVNGKVVVDTSGNVHTLGDIW